MAGITSLILVNLVALTLTNFELQVTFHTLHNLDGRCAGGSGCSGSGYCDGNRSPSSCRYVFAICVRGSGTLVSSQPHTDQGNCGRMDTGPSPLVRDSISFGSDVFGRPNPMIYSRQPPIQFHMEILSGSGATLFDRLGIEVSGTLPRRTYTGIFGYAHLEMTFTFVCAANYYGRNCDIFCEEDCKCVGVVCGRNQMCVTDNMCVCQPGFTGTNCLDVDYCQSSPCQNGGRCFNEQATFRCACRTGFMGTLCQEIVDFCDGVDCGRNRECIRLAINHTCVCRQGYTGPNCVDHCEGVAPCSNGGTCVNGESSFSCVCSVGFTGPLCDAEIDHCAGVSCGESQRCVNEILNYTCECRPGYTGTDCTLMIVTTVTTEVISDPTTQLIVNDNSTFISDPTTHLIVNDNGTIFEATESTTTSILPIILAVLFMFAAIVAASIVGTILYILRRKNHTRGHPKKQYSSRKNLYETTSPKSTPNPLVLYETVLHAQSDGYNHLSFVKGKEHHPSVSSEGVTYGELAPDASKEHDDALEVSKDEVIYSDISENKGRVIYHKEDDALEMRSLKPSSTSGDGMVYCAAYKRGEERAGPIQQGASQADHHKLPNDMVYCAAYGNGKGGRSTTNVPCVENVAYRCTIGVDRH